MKLSKPLALGLLVIAFVVPAAAQVGMPGPVRVAFDKLVTDTRAALADSTVTPAQFSQLKNDVAVALSGANKPSTASLARLEATIKAARADQTITPAERTAIQKAFDAVLKSANIPAAEADAVKSDLGTIVIASHVTQPEATLIVDDLRALLAALPEGPNRP